MIETATEVLCAAPLHRETEFDIITYGVRRMGGCGMAGLASAASSQTGTIYHPIDVYTIAYLRGYCDISGAITPYNLWRTALAMGLQVAAFRDYGEPWPDWQAWCEQQIDAGNPVVVETAAGQALWDSIANTGENAANLRYHYYAKLGRNRGGPSTRVGWNLPAGWWAADGDNFAGGNNNANNFNAANVLQYYSDEVVAKAQLCAGLALVGRGQKMAWTDGANGRGVDSKGHSCGPGDYAAIKAAGFAAFDGLNDEIYPDDALVDGSLLCLENGAIVACRKSANFRVSIATGSLDAAELVMETLQAVAAAKSAAAPAPAAALSAGEQADLDAMAWLRKSLIANGIS